jgi:hypothetical protein
MYKGVISMRIIYSVPSAASDHVAAGMQGK